MREVPKHGRSLLKRNVSPDGIFCKTLLVLVVVAGRGLGGGWFLALEHVFDAH